MDTFDKFSEEKLPPKKYRKNTPDDGVLSFCDGDLEHANLVFQEFDCKTLSDYHDICLHTDVLISASLFEKFRKVCTATFGLDYVHCYTASNLSDEALLTNVTLKLNF